MAGQIWNIADVFNLTQQHTEDVIITLINFTRYFYLGGGGGFANKRCSIIFTEKIENILLNVDK